MAIILVEQFFDFAYDLGDHMVVLKRGAVELTRPKADLTRDELLAAVAI